MQSFKELNIKPLYKSIGENQLNKDLVNPVLNYTKIYKRASAYFNSFVLETLLSGVEALYLNKGCIKLLISPQISKEDFEAILKASDTTKEFTQCLDKIIDKSLFEISDNYFELFYQMLCNGFIEIKFAITTTSGIYHDKLAIFEDFYGNQISFSGSANETQNAYENNYERVMVFKNCDASSVFHNENISEFDNLWNGKTPDLIIYDASKALKEKVINLVENGVKQVKKPQTPGLKPRSYQSEAIDSWKNKFSKQGFFVMATGTGKTFTSCFCINEVLEDDNPIVVILVPYIHLIAQWEESFKAVSTADYIIKLYSGNSPMWKRQLGHAINVKRRNKKLKVVIISTIKSWQSEYTQTYLNKYPTLIKMLVVDEAHRFGNLINEKIQNEYQYKIGLSATPLVGRKINSNLINFFGGVAYNLPIEIALEKGFLCNYNYFPIFVRTNELDEKKFKNISKDMRSCFNSNGDLKNGFEDHFSSLLRQRNRLLSLASSKTDYSFLKQLIQEIAVFNSNFIVYCGDGKVDDETRHLDYVKEVFDDLGFAMNRFTCEETMEDRLAIIDCFNRNLIDGLVAIRCLDEGIDIPSIKAALLLANGDNYREFVQRRGRILRKYHNKESADIFDLILLPTTDTPGIAEIEFRRFYEYARLSLNWNSSNKKILEGYIEMYNLDTDRIYNYFDNVSGLEQGEEATDE